MNKSCAKTERPTGRRWKRWSSILIRALHQLGAALFTAGLLLEVPVAKGWLLLAAVSGVLLIVLEVENRGTFLWEMTGGVTFVKLLLFGLAFHGLLPVFPAVTAAFLLASAGSHAPKDVRHRSLLRWRQ